MWINKSEARHYTQRGNLVNDPEWLAAPRRVS